MNERRKYGMSAKRTNSGRTYNQVKRNGVGGGKKS